MYRPIKEDEYAPYYLPYVTRVAEGDFIDILTKQAEQTKEKLSSLTDTQARYRYAPDKWSIKEVLGHIADTERVMAYRLLSVARGETRDLPGFDENDFIKHAAFNEQTLEDLIKNYEAVRQSTIHLIKSLSEEAYVRRGSANNYSVTVRALIAIIAGHELHHLSIIEERYMRSDAYPHE